MPNAIKYNTSAETLALKKGNFWIGTGDVGKGPTSSTGYYNGITPPSGGYTIYLNKASGGPSIYTVTTEAQLTGLTSTIAGQTLTTSGACLNYFATQTDKMIFNIDYPPIVTNGLMLNVDAAFAPSYPTTGTTFYDTSSSGKNGTLANGPTYTSANGGGIVLDGTDDTYSITGISMGTSAFTLDCWFKYQTHSLYLPAICFAGDYWSGDNQTGWGFGQNAGASNYNFQMGELGAKLSVSLGSMVDGTIYNFVGTRTISGSQQILRGYVNGVLVGSATGNTIFNLSTSTYFPGYNPTVLTPKQYSYTGPPPATLYNIKVYTRDLSATEISQNYEAIGTRYTSLQVQSLVVAGGGSGGGYGYPSGGGGAGGLLTGYTTSLTTNTNYTITVGAGGSSNSNGSNSVFNTLTSIGGGRGGNGRSGPGVSGGSGGGGATNYPADGGLINGLTPAGSGTVGQGNDGGVGKSVYGDNLAGGIPTGAGGGGGAGAVGSTGTTTPSAKSGNGGVGLYFSEYTTLGGYPSGWFAGGGGGGAVYFNPSPSTIGVGGNGGGGNGSYTQFSSGPTATDGIVNTGGGGGGAGYIENSSANGGSGIVILKIPDVYTARFSSGVSASVTKSGGYKYYKITATSTTSETVSFS
jgi:hypothetical protein